MKGASEYLSGVAWMNVMHFSCLGRGIGKCCLPYFVFHWLFVKSDT